MKAVVESTVPGTDSSAAEWGDRARSRRSRDRKNAIYGVLLVLPSVVLVVGVIAVPVVYLLQTSLTNAHAYLPTRDFVGLDNYVALFRADSAFWGQFGRTALYAGVTLVLQIVLGVLTALLLHQKFPGRPIIRVVALIPYMIPAVTVALVWRWLLDGSHGVWSQWLRALTGSDANWLGPDWIFTATIVVSVWMFAPFVTISVLARLQTIDTSMLEAAMLDGAGAFRRFFSIVLPELSGVLVMLVLLRFMFMFTKFDIVYLFAGTGESVRTLPLVTFQRTFGEARLGHGATVAIVMFVLLMVFVSVYLRLARTKEEQ